MTHHKQYCMKHKALKNTVHTLWQMNITNTRNYITTPSQQQSIQVQVKSKVETWNGNQHMVNTDRITSNIKITWNHIKSLTTPSQQQSIQVRVKSKVETWNGNQHMVKTDRIASNIKITWKRCKVMNLLHFGIYHISQLYPGHLFCQGKRQRLHRFVDTKQYL